MTYAKRKLLSRFIDLCKIYDISEVKSKLNLNSSEFSNNLRQARDIGMINQELFHNILTGKALSVKYREEAFSDNEDDYINFDRRNVFFTKEGMLVFKGNKTLVRQDSELSKEIRIYKAMTSAHTIGDGLMPEIAPELEPQISDFAIAIARYKQVTTKHNIKQL